jgi:hypothetical protein
MSIPTTTRLRYVSAKKPDELSVYLRNLRFRVQIYGAPVWDGKRWTLWFVLPDDINVELGNATL